MKGNERRISFILIAFLFITGWAADCFQIKIYDFPDVPDPGSYETTDLTNKRIEAGTDFVSNEEGVTGRTNYRDKELLVDEGFVSNLPLVIIDTEKQKPERGVIWDSEKEYYVPTGTDPYAYGQIYVVDNENGQNRPADSAQMRSFCKLKLRGNSSGNYDKEQYLIKLLDRKGKPERQNIFDMGSDSEWILNVSFIDKSLLRNYLAYMTVGEIMPYTPDVQFCEVLWKTESGYSYKGVYLMMESIKVGEYRVDLPKYSENSGTTPALLRRDRYNVNGIMLENYATKMGLTSGYLDIEYPDKDTITEKGIDNITAQVDRFERALYSDSWEEFVQYRKYVNMESFVDYFILNEFFLNYDAGYNSTYVYMDYSGKLNMGPVWDFDQAMDNNQTVSADLQTTAFHSAPWFDRILQDPFFTAALVERYSELRKSILSDEAIRSFVNETVEYLGPAIRRDWARWGYYYTEGNYLQPDISGGKDRNTHTHREETERILQALSEHAGWLDEHMDSLYQFKMISLEQAQTLSEDETTDYRPLLAIIFIAVFFISVKLVLRYESE